MAQQDGIVGFDKFLLMALFKEGAMSLRALERRTIIFLSRIWYLQSRTGQRSIAQDLIHHLSGVRYHLRHRSPSMEALDTESECRKLTGMGLVRPTQGGSYELTESGRAQAQQFVEGMEATARTVQSKILNPSATARNAVFIDFFLAIIKFGAGFVSGSVGLKADGVDAISDTIAAFLVWLGVRFKKEFLSTLLVIFMLFVASLSLGYESFSKILETFRGTIEPMGMPLLVVFVEGISLIAAVGLYWYQRQVGRMGHSLTLISQSVDSKNHIYLCIAVIAGALLSLAGIYFVDALIGAFVAVRIFLDSIGLLRDAIKSAGADNTDLSRYHMPFETYWESLRRGAFRIWILFAVHEEGLETKTQIVDSLKSAFGSPVYIPVLSELQVAQPEIPDFESEFSKLVQPLVAGRLLNDKDQGLSITDKGLLYLTSFGRTFRYYDVHLSDSLLLSMSRSV